MSPRHTGPILSPALPVLLPLLVFSWIPAVLPLEVLYAVNCGGDELVDSHGVHYKADPLEGRVGVSSDFGRQLEIDRVPAEDQLLYQTERYHTSTFGYELPHLGDGSYVLILGFSEVYFNAKDQKVFDVTLNGELTVVQDLDIFARVGYGVAHQEIIEFAVQDGRILYNDETSDIESGGIRVDFIKGDRDNPKVNAIVLIEGAAEDFPSLPPLKKPAPQPESTRSSRDSSKPSARKHSRPSGTPVSDPYESLQQSNMLPVVITLAACVPLILCFCRL